MLSQRNTLEPTENEELFRQLIEIKDYAIVMLSPEGDILSWNLGAHHIFGYSAKEIIGRHFSIVYNQDDLKASCMDNHLGDALEHGRMEAEWRLVKKDGALFFVNLIYTPLYGTGSTLRGFTAMVRDITIQKQLEEENKLLHENLEERVLQRTIELENANKELNAFSYSVSHDLRTPLRAIGGYSKMFLEDYAKILDEEGTRILNTIVENTELMGKLIDDLLEFSRLSRLEVLDEKINMKAIAERCIVDLLQIWQQKEYTINVDDLPACYADPNMMKQVWMNLIENALKYSSKTESPIVTISCIVEAQTYTYFVRDNGAGFDMQYATKLFGVFQRLHANDDFQGTGLGLALVNRIITKHNGHIWAESEVNRGATFYFKLPKTKGKDLSKIIHNK